MAISRMQEPRQLYGLGSLVKKAVRGVKKIVKSPIGKAAILGGLGMYGMGAGPFSGMKGSGFLRGLMGARNAAAGSKFLHTPLHGKLPASVAKKGFFTSGFGRFLNPMSGAFGEKNKWKHGFGLAAAGATALPFLMGKGDEEEDVVEEAWDQVPSSIANIRSQAKNYYTDPASSTLAFMPNKQFVNQNWYAADGGRAGLMNGGEPGQEQIEQMLMAEYVKYKNQGGTLTFEQFVQAIMQQQQEGQGMEQPQEVAMAANGGRIGYRWGGLGNLMSRTGGAIKKFKDTLVTKLGRMTDDVEISTSSDYASDTGASMDIFITAKSKKGKTTLDGLVKEGILDVDNSGLYTPKAMLEDDAVIGMEKLKVSGLLEEGLDFTRFDKGAGMSDYGVPGYGYDQLVETFRKIKKADGGRIGAYKGGLMSEDEDEYSYNPQAAMRMYKRPGKQEGGIMETEEASEMIDMGGQEKDYRETGGFVEIGGKERADDVPARLSKNEFVFTADAVRAAGGGDIDAGSEVMQNMMDNLEAGGEISEESQGLEGAQAMYDQQQMLQSRIA